MLLFKWIFDKITQKWQKSHLDQTDAERAWSASPTTRDKGDEHLRPDDEDDDEGEEAASMAGLDEDETALQPLRPLLPQSSASLEDMPQSAAEGLDGLAALGRDGEHRFE